MAQNRALPIKTSDLPGLIADMEEIVQAAALRPEQWQEVVDRLRRRLGNIKVVLQAWDRGTARPFFVVSTGIGPDLLRAYAAYYAQLNPWAGMWSGMPYLTPVWTDSFMPNAEIRKTEFYHDFLSPIGEADSGTSTKLIDDPSRLATFGINYGSAQGEAMHALVDPVMRAVAANMRRAIDANRTLYRSTLAGTTQTNLLAALIDPAFVVDRFGRLLAANDPGQKLIAEGRLLRVGAQDLVHFDDAQAHSLFSERVRRACSPFLDDERRGIEDLPIVHPSGAFTVTLLPVRQNFQSMTLKGVLPLFLPTTVALVIIRPRVQRSLREELRQRYRLTEAEARVTLALLDWSTLAQVGDALGISYETVRSHLRGAFTKTGTSKQKQLIALVLSLPRTGAPPFG